jgi:hypothetical protein
MLKRRAWALAFARAAVTLALTYLILARFGWLGLLISLPFFFLVPFLLHWRKERWRRRGSLR